MLRILDIENIVLVIFSLFKICPIYSYILRIMLQDIDDTKYHPLIKGESRNIGFINEIHFYINSDVQHPWCPQNDESADN